MVRSTLTSNLKLKRLIKIDIMVEIFFLIFPNYIFFLKNFATRPVFLSLFGSEISIKDEKSLYGPLGVLGVRYGSKKITKNFLFPRPFQ